MQVREPDIAMTTQAASSSRTSLMIKAYYELTKPGITQMVALSTLAGYYLAIPGDLGIYASQTSNWLHFVCTLVGAVLTCAGSAVINHVIERDADAKMKRTATRPIPSGLISVRAAVTFGVALTAAGLLALMATNTLTILLAVITWLSYVVVYTPLKKKTSLAVIIGGVPGALPFMGGWTAIHGSVDAVAWALFAIMFMWQLPHFYALSWMYRNDYQVGGFALRAIKSDNHKILGIQIIATSLVTAACAVLPTLLHATGWMYGTGAALLGLWLTFEGIRFYNIGDTPSARRVLLTSYAFLMGVLLLMFLDKA